MAAKGLCELRRLAVADALGDLTHGQAVRGEKGCGVLHANPGQMFAEGGASDLRVGALQLAARGGHAARDVIEAEIGAVFLLDDHHRLLEQARAMADRRGALRHDTLVTPKPLDRINGTPRDESGALALGTAGGSSR